MKEQDLLKTLGDVDEKFIDEAAPDTAEKADYTEIIPRKEPLYMKILPISACAALVAIGVGAGILINKVALNPAYKMQGESSYQPDIYISSAPANNSSSFTSSVSEDYRVPHWDELDINGQYTSFKWQGCAYDTAGAEISAEKLGEFLGETTASGVDEYTDEKHEITVSVYPIAKINEKTALAVQFPENEKFYVYYNQNYTPRTLGDFIDDLNLEEYLEISDTATGTSIENLYLTNRKYSDIDTSKLMEILLSGRNVPTESMFDYNTFVECDRFEAALDFAVDIPILGIENLSLEITKGGFVHTNAFFHTSTLFYLGKDKTDPFVQYVKENCPSEILSQSDEPLKTQEEIRGEVLSAFKELGYLNFGIFPGILSYRPDLPSIVSYRPEWIDFSTFITDKVVEPIWVSSIHEINFYLVKSGDYSTEEGFIKKLDEILTEGCRENYFESLKQGYAYRFRDGKTYVSAVIGNEHYRDPDKKRKVVISAKFDEERSNLLNVTVTEIIGDESKGTQYNAIFEKGADEKYRICTADFDGISEIFSSTSVDYTFFFDAKATGSISTFWGSV